MPRVTAIIVSRGKATLRDLQEYYSYEDALNLLEIIQVDNHNEHLAWRQ